MSFFKSSFSLNSNSTSNVNVNSNSNPNLNSNSNSNSRNSTSSSSSNSNSNSNSNFNSNSNINIPSSSPVKKKSLTYILHNSDEMQMKGHHSMGVNSLIYNKYDSCLISGGRDGQISIWKFNQINSDTVESNNDIYDNFRSGEDIRNHLFQNLDNESEFNNLESSINNGVSSVSTQKINSLPKHYKNSYLHHFGWINDMKLLEDNQTIVSCSNDLSIKLWNYNTNSKFTLGFHDDYIKKIGYTKSFNDQLVSAGLDKVVKIWDITKGKAISNYKFKDFNSSIYSLDVNDHLIISSGPSNIISLFDRRDMNKPIKSFLGHTDNVRSLILKDNSFLSGSSDTSIKLWDLRSTRILRNFEMHDSPVWSLYSPSYADGFSIFYSADKSGLLVKTDLRSSDLNSKNVGGYFNHKVNESSGISTVIANVNYSNSTVDELNSKDLDMSLVGINDIVEPDNLGTVWTATASSTHNSNTNFISSWSIPQTGKLVMYQGLVLNRKLAALYNNNNTEQMTPNSNPSQYFQFQSPNSPNNQYESQLDAIKSNESLTDADDLVSQLSNDDLDHIDNALFSNSNDLDNILNENNSAYIGQGIEESSGNEEDVYEYATCFVGLLGDLNTHFLFTQDYFDKVEQDDESIDPFNESLNPFSNANNENIQIKRKMEINHENINDDEVLLLPFNTKPISTISGTSGLVKCKMLNNRRHVATMDQCGCIYIFDILSCKLIKRVDNHISINKLEIGNLDHDKSMTCEDQTNEDDLNFSDRFEAVCDKLQTQETLPRWCSVQVKSGQLFITLKENAFTSCEIYRDDFYEQYKYLNNNEVEDGELSQRVNLGKILVKSFFANILNKILADSNIDYNDLIHQDLSSQTMQKDRNSSISTINSTVPPTSTPQTRINNSNSNSQPATGSSTSDKSNGSKRGIFGRLKTRDSRRESVTSFSSNNNSTSPKNNNNSIRTKSKLEIYTEMINQIESTPKILKFIEANPDSISIFLNDVTERKQDAPLFEYINITERENVNQNDISTLIVINEENLNETKPVFTIHLDQLLSCTPPKKLLNELRENIPIWIAKVVLLNVCPIPTSMTMKIGFVLSSEEGSQLGNIDEGTCLRLNAVGTLRVSRIIEFVQSKLPEKDRRLDLDILCKGQVLDEKITLGTLKARVWRQGGEIELTYCERKQIDE